MSNSKRKRADSDSPRHDVGPIVPRANGLINTLSNACLANIFRHLPIKDRLTIQQVCKRWGDKSDLVWGDLRSLDFTTRDLSPFVDGGLELILTKSGKFLTELTFELPTGSKILKFIEKYCCNLERLYISFFGNDETSDYWFPQIENLKYLVISGISLHFSEYLFQALPHENLNGLHLRGRGRRKRHWSDCLPPNLCGSVLDKFTQLSVLVLSGFSLTPIILMPINQMFNLTFLSLEDCAAKSGLPRLNMLSKLEQLNLSKVPQVNDDYLHQLSINCKTIKYLDLRDCRKVTNQGITSLQRLPRLEVLILYGLNKITDISLSKLYRLKQLKCPSCANVANAGIIELIKNAPNLEDLNLCWCRVDRDLLVEVTNMMNDRDDRANDTPLEILCHPEATYGWNARTCHNPLLTIDTYSADLYCGEVRSANFDDPIDLEDVDYSD